MDTPKISKFEEDLRRVEFCIETITQFEKPVKGMKKLLSQKPRLTYEDRRSYSIGTLWEGTWNSLKTSDDLIRHMASEKSRTEAEIEVMRPWQAFDASTTELSELTFAGYALGTLPEIEIETLKRDLENRLPDTEFEMIQTLKEEVLVFILCHKDDSELLTELLKAHGFSKNALSFEAPPLAMIRAAQAHLENLNRQKGKLIEDIHSHHSELEGLKLIRDYCSSELKKAQGSEQMAKTDRILLIEGWVAKDRVSELDSLISRVCSEDYEIELTDPTEKDNVPVLLKNNAFNEAFEPVTAMYSLPSYFETDPTPVYAPFMFVFFGMMLSDAAYGLFLSAVSLWALKALDLNESRRKFIKLFFFLGISTMFFGVLYGSYFGDILSKAVKPVWLDPSTDPMAVLMVAIIMGGIHLFTGLGIRAFNLIKNGHVLDAVFDVGFWYLTLTGAALMLIGASSVGKPMAVIGAIGLVLTQGRDNKGIFGKLAGGLFGLYGITGYLGDVLSYSRLLALGLATGLIGSSFNLMVKLVGFSPLAFIFAVMIFLGGHTFNLLINILGAYVHAVRLQYLEFFGKFYTGGGKAFAPLSSEMKYYNLIK
jgi:V/A-type H+-transporting ATPase subunit I